MFDAQTWGAYASRVWSRSAGASRRMLLRAAHIDSGSIVPHGCGSTRPRVEHFPIRLVRPLRLVIFPRPIHALRAFVSLRLCVNFCQTNPSLKNEIPNKNNRILKTRANMTLKNEPKFNHPQLRPCWPIGPLRLIRPMPSCSCSSWPPLPRPSATKTGRILDSLRQYESPLHPKSSRIKPNQPESTLPAKKNISRPNHWNP